MLSLNIPPWNLFGWFRRLQLWATGDWQLHCDNVPIHTLCLVQSFLVKHQINQVTQPPYSPDFTPCNFWLFPKLKSSLERYFRSLMRFRKIWWSSWWWLGELCVRSQDTYFEGDWGIVVLCTMFIVSCIFFKKCLFFILHGWITSGQTWYMPFYTVESLKLPLE